MINHELEISLNRAVSEAQKRSHDYVTVEHMLYALLENSHAKQALRACGVSFSEIRKDLEGFFDEKLEKVEMAEGQVPQPTMGFQRILQRAAQSVLAAGKDKIGGDSVLIAIFGEKDSFALYFLQKQEVGRFDLVNFVSHGIAKDGAFFQKELPRVTGGEPSFKGQEEPTGESHVNQEEEEPASKTALELYAVDLCKRAQEGKIDPLIGRSDEIDRTIQILCRRRKNNPLLVGEPGVGKTAIAEGLALKIVQGEVPTPLKGAEIYGLDMGTVLAGTKFRGEFEQRLKGVVNEIRAKENALLFIDEIHTIIGAGSVSGGTMDASNLLKPALSSGELRCIGSTTYKEFRQHFEQDSAMARRFQKIDILEPSKEETIEILKGLKLQYESHHNVTYSLEAIKEAVDLSIKYMRDKQLPDKAIDVIDEVGAFLSLKSDKNSGKKKRSATRVKTTDIRKVISQLARVPLEKMSSTAKSQLEGLADRLQQLVFGQEVAVLAVEGAIRLSKAGLREETKPIGSFLFAGPTGVGKTELAKQLANELDITFLRFDMSEYMERHAVSRLIGAPPGYVGFDEGGLLTEKVNKNPHAVLLLDEIEKAHPDVHNVLLQIMDHGTLTDSNGRQIDFRNVIVIMTSNVGAAEMSQQSIGFTPDPGGEINVRGNSEALKRAFSPEFRNRLDAVVTFGPLPSQVIHRIVGKLMRDLSVKLAAKKVSISISDAARDLLSVKGYHPSYGARPMANTFQKLVKKPLADMVLFGELSQGGAVHISVDPKNSEKLHFEIEPPAAGKKPNKPGKKSPRSSKKAETQTA